MKKASNKFYRLASFNLWVFTITIICMYLKALFKNNDPNLQLSPNLFSTALKELFSADLIYLFVTTLAEMIGTRLVVDRDEINKRTVFNITVTVLMIIVYIFSEESRSPLVVFFAKVFAVCFLLAVFFEYTIEWKKSSKEQSEKNPDNIGSRPDEEHHD